MIADGITVLGTNGCLLAGMLVVMFWLNWRFALVSLSVAPLLFWTVFRYKRRIKAASRRARASTGQLASLAQETLASIRIVQGLSQEEQQDERFQERSESHHQANLDVARGPIPHHNGDSDGSKDVHQRHYACLVPHDVKVRLMMTLTAFLETLVLLLFLRQPLHDADGSKRLLGQGGQLSGAGPRPARSCLNTALVAEDRPKQQRSYRERDQGEPPVEPEHHHQHSRQQTAIGTEHADPVGNHLLDRLGVRCKPRGQVAGPLVIVKSQGKTL